MVSAVHDFARGFSKDVWTLEQILGYEKLVEIVKEQDKKLDLPDCEDPEKAALLTELQELKERLRQLEQKVAEKKT